MTSDVGINIAAVLAASAEALNHGLVRNKDELMDAIHAAGATLRMDLDKIEMLYFDGMTYRISRPLQSMSMADAINSRIRA